MKKRAKKWLSGVLAVICVVSGGLYLGYVQDFRSGDDAYEAAMEAALQPQQEEIIPAVLPEEPSDEPYWAPVPVTDDPNMEEMAKKNLTALRQTNEDVVAWIWIPDSRISYPVMQGEDNDFYLNHTWQKKENAVGSIFLEWQISPDFSEFNTIVYGHNMKNKTMFSQLHDYQDSRFRDAHPYVYLLTDNGVWRYEVFSCYQAEVGSDTYQFGMQWDKTKEEYIDRCLKKSLIDCKLTPAVTDRILTLSTCSGLGGVLGTENRFVVHAYLPMELTQ